MRSTYASRLVSASGSWLECIRSSFASRSLFHRQRQAASSQGRPQDRPTAARRFITNRTCKYVLLLWYTRLWCPRCISKSERRMTQFQYFSKRHHVVKRQAPLEGMSWLAAGAEGQSGSASGACLLGASSMMPSLMARPNSFQKVAYFSDSAWISSSSSPDQAHTSASSGHLLCQRIDYSLFGVKQRHHTWCASSHMLLSTAACNQENSCSHWLCNVGHGLQAQGGC